MYEYDSEEEWTACVQTAELYAELRNDVDKQMATSKSKNGKAMGHYQNPAELKKKKVRELKKIIYEPRLKIWEEETVPQEWIYGIICSIHRRET